MSQAEPTADRRPRRRIRLALAAVVCGVLTLTACGQGTQATDPPATSTQTGTRTVVDMTGRTVELPATVNRVASDFPALNATMRVLGAADRLVAVSPGAGPLFSKLVPGYDAVPKPFDATLANVNEEQLLGTKPDVVLLPSPALLPTFERLGIPAVVFVSFQNPEQLKAGVELVAEVVGGSAPGKAKAFADYYDGNIARVAQKIQPDTPRPRAYYTAGNPTQTEGQNSIVDVWMTQTGAQNVAAANGVNTAPAFANVTLEDVVRWDPQVIVVRDAVTKGEILGDARWATVAAVRDGKVVANPTGVYVWSVRSAESALQPLWAAKTFHPELFGDIDMTVEVTRFYHDFYGYDLAPDEAAKILNPAG